MGIYALPFCDWCPLWAHTCGHRGGDLVRDGVHVQVAPRLAIQCAQPPPRAPARPCPRRRVRLRLLHPNGPFVGLDEYEPSVGMRY
eukprot:662931-Pyramimonas_sp.AAC.1